MLPAIRLGAADSAWWRMEEPVNQMTITAVLTFGGPMDFARLRSRRGTFSEHRLFLRLSGLSPRLRRAR